MAFESISTSPSSKTKAGMRSIGVILAISVASLKIDRASRVKGMPVGVGQPTLMIGGLTVGGSAT